MAVYCGLDWTYFDNFTNGLISWNLEKQKHLIINKHILLKYTIGSVSDVSLMIVNQHLLIKCFLLIPNKATDILVDRLIYGIIVLWEVTLMNSLYHQTWYNSNTNTEQI